MIRLSDVELVYYWPGVKTGEVNDDWYGIYPNLAVAEAAIMQVAREWWPRDATLPPLPSDPWEAVDLLAEHEVIFIRHIDDYDMGLSVDPAA
jgi:hypothetical protein